MKNAQTLIEKARTVDDFTRADQSVLTPSWTALATLAVKINDNDMQAQIDKDIDQALHILSGLS